MLKLRSIHIFLLALTMLLGAVVDRGFHISSINTTNSSTNERHQDFEDLGPETKYYPVLISFLQLDFNSHFYVADSDILFDLTNNVKNLTLPLLLGSHRIALPPPFLV